MSHDLVGHRTLEVMSAAPAYNRWLYRLIRPYLKGHVCEIGAGTGTFTRLLVDGGFKVTAVDIDPAYLRLISRQIPEADTKAIDMDRLSLPKNLNSRFDTVIAINVIEHLKDDSVTLKNIYRLLPVGGEVIILVPAHPSAYGTLDKNLGHYRRYTTGYLNSVLEKNGFKVRDSRYINILGLLGWIWSGKIMHHQILPSGPVKLFNLISKPLLGLENYLRFPVGLSVVCIAQKS